MNRAAFDGVELEYEILGAGERIVLRSFREGFMFQFVRRVVGALLKRLRPFSPPEDPYAAVREPRRRNPNGRSSAVALAEPEPGNPARAVGGTKPARDRA